VEEMSRNNVFFQVLISHVSRYISICDLFTDSPSYVSEKGDYAEKQRQFGEYGWYIIFFVKE
jgi:hypothetical protein